MHTPEYQKWLDRKLIENRIQRALDFGEEIFRLVHSKEPALRYSESNGQCLNQNQVEEHRRDLENLKYKIARARTNSCLDTSID